MKRMTTVSITTQTEVPDKLINAAIVELWRDHCRSTPADVSFDFAGARRTAEKCLGAALATMPHTGDS